MRGETERKINNYELWSMGCCVISLHQCKKGPWEPRLKGKDDLMWKNKWILCVDVLSNCCKQGLIDLEGSLRCHDGDDIENVKRAIGWIRKTATLQVQHAFLYISLPSLNVYDVKIHNFTFCGGRKQGPTKSSFSFWTLIWFLGIWLRKSWLAFDIGSELE